MTDVPSTSASVPVATEPSDPIRIESRSRKPIRIDKEPFVLPPKRPRYKNENARLAKAASSNKQFTTYRRIAEANHLSKTVSVITMSGKYPVVPQHLPYNSTIVPQHLPYNNPVLPQHLTYNSSTAALNSSVLFPVKRLCPRKMDSFEDEAQTELVETIKQKILNDTAKRQAEAGAMRPRMERMSSTTANNNNNNNNINSNNNTKSKIKTNIIPKGITISNAITKTIPVPDSIISSNASYNPKSNFTRISTSANTSSDLSTNDSTIPSFAITANLPSSAPSTSTVCEHTDTKSGTKCKQRAILCYRYCIRHILCDPRAPYTQCEHLCRPRNKKSEVSRCTNAVRNDSGEVLCSTHLIMYGMKDVRKKKMQYADYYYEDYYNPNSLNGEFMYLTSARSPSPNSPNAPSTAKMMKTTLSEPPLPPIQIPQLPQLGQTDFSDTSYETKRPVYNFVPVPAFNNQEFTSNKFSTRPPAPEMDKIVPLLFKNDEIDKTSSSYSSMSNSAVIGSVEDLRSYIEPSTGSALNIQISNDSDAGKSKDTTASTIDTIIEEVRLAARRSVQARAELAENKVQSQSKPSPSPRKPAKRIPKKIIIDDEPTENRSKIVSYQSAAVADDIVRDSFDVNIVKSSEVVYVQPMEKYSAKINSSSPQEPKKESDVYSSTLKRKLIREERALKKKLKRTPGVFARMGKILKETSIGPTFSTLDSVGAEVKEGKNLREIVKNIQSKTMRTNLNELEALQNEDENMCYSPFNWLTNEDFKEELLEADDDSFTFVNFCSGYWDEQTFWEKSRKVRNREISQYSYEKLDDLLVRVNALSDHMKNSDISQRVQNRFSCTSPDSPDGVDVDYDDLKKCHHVENNIRCNKSCLPYANHCSNHVLYSVSQRLFSFCTHTCCRRPVVSVDVIVWDGKCRLHRASLYDKYDSDGELIVKEIESSAVPLHELYGKGKYDTVPNVTRKPEITVIGQAMPVMPVKPPIRESPIAPKMNDNFLHTLNTTTPDIGVSNSLDNMKDDTLYEGDGEVGDLLKFIDGENEDLDSFSLEIEQ